MFFTLEHSLNTQYYSATFTQNTGKFPIHELSAYELLPCWKMTALTQHRAGMRFSGRVFIFPPRRQPYLVLPDVYQLIAVRRRKRYLLSVANSMGLMKLADFSQISEILFMVIDLQKRLFE